MAISWIHGFLENQGAAKWASGAAAGERPWEPLGLERFFETQQPSEKEKQKDGNLVELKTKS